SDLVLNDALVHAHVFGRRLVPGEVLQHATLHHGSPLLLVTEGPEGALQGSHQIVRAVSPELEAVTSAIGLLVDGVCETSRSANHGDGAVLQAIDLVEATGFIAGRHQEDIRAGLY